MKMDVICIETEAYYKLIQEFIDILKEKEGQEEELWVNTEKSHEHFESFKSYNDAEAERPKLDCF